MEGDARRSERFDEYLDRLCTAMRHADRHEPLRKYCTGLVLPGFRKSVEPIAARVSPGRVSAEHQSLLHLVGQAPWSDEAVLQVARGWASPLMTDHGPIEAWIVDDTGIPKKGEHSVGVANQYCGVLGKNHNCQVSVSISVANQWASLPVAHRLYLPESWAQDLERRKKAHVPEEVTFAKKWEIALGLIDGLLAHAKDLPRATVVADPGYGDTFEFRRGLSARGLRYVVGVSSTISVWPPGQGPLPPSPYPGRGRPSKNVRRDAGHQPVPARDLARSLPEEAWHQVTWREGTEGQMSSRFAAVRVRPAHRDFQRSAPHPEEWLLIEWPEEEKEPTKYWLSTERIDIPIAELVHKAKLRWRIERDYRELKQEVGFGHYEGRGWRGFHHHLTLCIAVYAFLLAERARLSPPDLAGLAPVPVPPLPRGWRPRGSPDPRGAPPTHVHPDDAPRTRP